MRSNALACCLTGLVVALAWAGCQGVDKNAPAADADPMAQKSPILDVIDVGPYEVPDLPLQENDTYAYGAADVQPFGYVKPYRQHFLRQMEYTGPGRAIPEPEHVETVKIGFLGPIEPTVSVATGGKSHEEILGKAMLRGAEMAIAEANAAGGYQKRGVPFELVVHNDNGLWGASGNEIVDMAYKEGVWAILGTIDGANTHIGIRVALKAEVVMLTTGDTDPTYIETNIPWAFRSIGDDRQQNYLLMDYMYRLKDYQRVAIIRASNRYGRFGVREIRDGSRRLGRPVVIEMAYAVGTEDFSLQLDRVEDSQPDAIVHWGDGADGARLLNAIRARGMKQPVFNSDRCASDEFIAIAGENAEGIICGFPWDPTRRDAKLVEFRRAYREKYGEEMETYAAHGYDGVNLLIWSIREAGLNRAKIRDVLAHRDQPWPGVTGDISLSAAMDDDGKVFLARCEGGAWKYYTREDLAIPQGSVRSRDSRQDTPAAVSEAGAIGGDS